MSEPWFGIDPNYFGTMYGTIIGGGGGVLIGTFGAFAGYAAPRGKWRRMVISAFLAFVLLGVVQLVLGLAALMSRQPYGIWYPMLLCGGITTIVTISVFPTILKRYGEAEHRRLDAEAIRRS